MANLLAFRFDQCFGPFTMSKGYLKREFLDIYQTTSFRVRKFENTSAMRVIYFLKMFKVESKLRKLKKKFRKYFLFLR